MEDSGLTLRIESLPILGSEGLQGRVGYSGKRPQWLIIFRNKEAQLKLLFDEKLVEKQVVVAPKATRARTK